MNFAVRSGKFDVVIVAGPGLENWPSVGVRAVSYLCAEVGLTVGQFGGESLTVKGVIPLPGTGGLVLAEDVQHRIHRMHARAIIRMAPRPTLPDPFPGWTSQGLIPIATAERLRRESHVVWDPTSVILGTGNRALQLGSSLLESGVPEVYCVETYAQWGAKRFEGWEVFRRRFEMAGGKLIEAKPLQLIPKSPLLWQLRLQDSQGIRVLDVARVISAGPFHNLPGIREYPPGSFLYELDQTAGTAYDDDVEGWVVEEERGRWLAGKIIKALVTTLGAKRDELDPTFRRARSRLKRYFKHRETPFTPSYQGKWISVPDTKKIRSFPGVPQNLHRFRPIASIECFEEIPCQICQSVCPTSAIQIGKASRQKNSILNEAACTACGICVKACPSGTISLIHENENRSTSLITLPWRGQKVWSTGELTTLLNRRGEQLGSARIVNTYDAPPAEDTHKITHKTTHDNTHEDEENKQGKIESRTIENGREKVQLVQLEIPTHLIWEGRALKCSKPPPVEDRAYFNNSNDTNYMEKVEINLNGEKRLVRDKIPINIALFDIGQNRPQDQLLCKDGSCGLCLISVDSVKKLACQTRIRRGMGIRTDVASPPENKNQLICPCLGITQNLLLERLKNGKFQSPEAVLSVTHIGEGKCHGQLCMGAFRRILLNQGLATLQWIDWRFPWSDWVLPLPHN